MRQMLTVVLALAFCGAGGLAGWAKEAKPKKPKLEIRAVPRMGMAPVEVLLLLDLRGGDDLEEFYCPEVEVNWGDGGKSVQAPDCPPFESSTKITRHFSISHEFRGGGEFDIRVKLVRTERTIAGAQERVSIRPPLGGIE
jgi:hypothetical protein